MIDPRNQGSKFRVMGIRSLYFPYRKTTELIKVLAGIIQDLYRDLEARLAAIRAIGRLNQMNTLPTSNCLIALPNC